MSRDKQDNYYELERLLRVRRIDIEKQGCDLYSLLHKTETEEQSLARYLIDCGYCKASDLAEEIFAENHNMLLKILKATDDGLGEAIRKDDEKAKDVYAGAKETIRCTILCLAELKKKYTEGGKE